MAYPGGTTPAPEAYVPLTKVTVLTLQGTTPVLSREVYFEGSYLDSRRVGSQVRTVFQGFAYGPVLKYNVYDLYAPQTSAPTAETKDGSFAPTPPVEDTSPKTGTALIAALEKLRAENHAILNARSTTGSPTRS